MVPLYHQLCQKTQYELTLLMRILLVLLSVAITYEAITRSTLTAVYLQQVMFGWEENGGAAFMTSLMDGEMIHGVSPRWTQAGS